MRDNNLIDRYADFPVLRLVVPFAVGIVAANACRQVFSPSSSVLFAACVATGVATALSAIIPRLDRNPTLFGLLLHAFLFLSGMAMFFHKWRSTEVRWPEKPIACRAVVMSPPDVRGKLTTCRLLLTDQKDSAAWRPTHREIQLAMYAVDSGQSLRCGDALLLWAKIAPPRNMGNPYEMNYADYQRFHGIGGTAFVYAGQVVMLSAAEAAQVRRERLGVLARLRIAASNCRDKMLLKYRQSGLAGQQYAVVAALTLGDRRQVSVATKQLYSRVGASHILALSGLHLGILFGILEFLLLLGDRNNVRRRALQPLALLLVWAFVFIAGMPTSLIRAAVMCSVMSVALMLQRDSAAINSLAIAAAVLLLANPCNLFDVGFQMSFLAVLFILCHSGKLTPEWVYPHRLLRVLWALVVVSLCAQIGVAPLVAYYFHNFPTYFLLTNFIVVPLAYVLIATAVLFFAIGFWPWAQLLVGRLLSGELAVLYGGLAKINSLPHSALHLYPTLFSVVAFYVLVVLAYKYVRVRARTTLLLACIVCVLMTTAEAAEKRQERPQPCIWFYSLSSCPTVHFIVNRNENYLWAPLAQRDAASFNRKTNLLRRNYWQRVEMQRPTVISDSINTKALCKSGPLVAFGTKTLLLLDKRVGHCRAHKPLQVDYIYVCRGFKGRLADVASLYSTRMLVLDTSLSEYMRGKLEKEARELGWRVYDIRQSGALKVDVR